MSGFENWQVALAVTFALVVAACGSSPAGPESRDEHPVISSSSDPLSPKSTLAATATEPPVTATMATTSTSTRTVTVAPDSEIPSTWIGVEFTVTTPLDHVRDDEILINVEHLPVELLVDGGPAGVHGWYVGGAFVPSVVVVGSQKNPYMPDEYSQEVEGALPRDPDASARHDLMVWAITPTAAARYRITDTMEITLHGGMLGYGALISTDLAPWLCELDPALGEVYAFFDPPPEVEFERRYTAHIAFTITEGSLQTVPPESVACILLEDPENY